VQTLAPQRCNAERIKNIRPSTTNQAMRQHDSSRLFMLANIAPEPDDIRHIVTERRPTS
jgi:hypothetical protein